jgi:DNA-binding beta-propeller fold protein YncE
VGIDADSSSVYVADNVNHRILRYDSLGDFQLTWGRDVIEPASPGNVGVTAEICVDGADTCKPGVSGGEGGEMNSPGGVAVEPSGQILVSEFLGRRVQRFDSSGNFQRTWGRDVTISGRPGDLGTVFEVCTVAVDCKGGLQGALAGEFFAAFDVAADPAGNVYAGDGLTNANRIQKFDQNGIPLRLWGRNVVDSGPSNLGDGVFENCLAAGNLYVGESNGDRVHKFVDPPPPEVAPPTPVTPLVPLPAAPKKCKKGQKPKMGKCVKKRKKKRKR